ncbi:MAG TPA: DUF4158 domain-containing protein, partial [Gammaproteobacteria bacterium]|nr:DUF4158 domain-containing protein [Gammaproteobacteria bacterium]
MPHSQTSLLSPTEQRDLYGIPVLNEIERQEYFTLNTAEMNMLNRFVNIKEAVYFVVTLVFFKLKHTIISFQYQDVTAERQHVMKRYFPDQISPKSMPNKSTKYYIDLKIIELCHYKRFNKSVINIVKQDLQAFAPYAPRQRQLLKKLLQILTKHHITTPGHTTLQNIVSQAWNQEQKRVLLMYTRQTTSKQRKIILALLNKTEETAAILMMKGDLKNYNTHDLWKELEKYGYLKVIFDIAKNVLQRLNLPMTTYEYYASLIHYYDRPQMKR